MSINLALWSRQFAVCGDRRRQEYLCLERGGICISEYECRKRRVRDQAARPPIESLIQPEEPVSVLQRRKLPGNNCLEGWSDVGSRDVLFCEAADEQVKIADGPVDQLQIALQNRISRDLSK